MKEIELHKIDKNNFFYELITTLCYAQFGANELFSRGFILLNRKNHPDFNDFIRYVRTLPFPDDVKEGLIEFKGFTPHILVPGFFKRDRSLVYRMNPNNMAFSFVAEHRGKGGSERNIRLTHMTILAAWELVVGLGLTSSPIMEFFRHIRNAAAHNGKFDFHSRVIDKATGDLKKAAEWNSFKITTTLQGKHLIALDKLDTDCFLDQGDIVEFLLDFETYYPQIKKP